MANKTTTVVLKTQRDILTVIRSAITAWVKTTKEGKKAWEYSSDDMNIGDIGDDPPLSLRRLPNKEGITGWTCVWQGGGLDTVPYDTVLVDESELDDDDDEDDYGEDADG